MIGNNRKDIINPPVGPMRNDIPLPNPENTGSPIVPINMYVKTAENDILKLNNKHVSKIANVWSVIPIKKGIVNQAEIIIIAVQTDIKVIL